jgi:phosphatidylcholine synthase
MLSRKTAAWLVHFYTATGGIVGMFALFAAARGEIRTAFLLLVLTMLIDATDGMMARRVNVREVLPNFDGAQIDNIIDFLTYIWIPVFIIGWEGLLPNIAWIAIPVIAGLYAYGQVDMKTPDAFFLGFPSYWNVVALYMYWLQPTPIIAILIVLIPGILTFIPTRYLYPSKNYILWKTSWGLTGLWFLLVIYLLLQEHPDTSLIILSLFYPAYYLIVSFFIDIQIRRGKIHPQSSH